jgi:hypothetical protein
MCNDWCIGNDLIGILLAVKMRSLWSITLKIICQKIFTLSMYTTPVNGDDLIKIVCLYLRLAEKLNSNDL